MALFACMLSYAAVGNIYDSIYTESIALGSLTKWASGKPMTAANVDAGCGAATVIGTEAAWDITMGNGNSAPCVVTFTTQAPVRWVCQVNNKSASGVNGLRTIVFAATTTSITLQVGTNTGAFGTGWAAGNVVQGICHAI